jgi:hypothetical protein
MLQVGLPDMKRSALKNHFFVTPEHCDEAVS